MKEKLFHLIVCPKCFGQLVYDEQQQTLCCAVDSLEYSISDGIPVLIDDEAKHIPDTEVKVQS